MSPDSVRSKVKNREWIGKSADLPVGEEALFRCLRKDEKDMRPPGRKNGKIVDRKMVLAVCSNSPNIGIGV